jgi:hypothetical protein
MKVKARNYSGLSEDDKKKLTEIKDRASKYKRLNFIVIFFAYLIGEIVALALGLPGYIGLSLQIFLPLILLMIFSKKLRKHTNQVITIGQFKTSWFDQYGKLKTKSHISQKKKTVSDDGVYAKDIPYDTSFEEHLNKN